MGLLDLFTGAASERAARNNRATIAAGQGQALGALGAGYDNAEGYLRNNALPALAQGYGQARGDLGTQYGQTTGALDALSSLYQPLAQQGQGAYSAYEDAIGANGQDGYDRATANFRAGPGYKFAMDQGVGRIMAGAAARGGLAGGNTTADILRFSQGLADQSYQSYVNNLRGGSDFYSQGLAGQAGALGAKANASQGYGNALAALGQGLGQGEVGIYGQLGGLETARGQGTAGIIGQTTNAFTQNNNALAQSENAAGANILGGILGLAGLGVGGAGAAAGRVPGAKAGGTLGGNMFAGFGNALSAINPFGSAR